MTVSTNGSAEVSSGIRAALQLLLQAGRYARDVHREPWDFALEIGGLHDAGLTPNDLRWLVLKGYVEHAAEVTGRAGRRFRPAGVVAFAPNSCFVLTDKGARFAQDECFQANPLPGAAAGGRRREAGDTAPADAPRWDDDRRTLCVGRQVVKRYRRPAPNQVAILAALEEEGWPPRVDDPLPPLPDLEPKRRLSDAIQALNLHRESELIRFRGDGTGTGVCWERVR
ncbi:MAG TPA: hypothetical protein VG013_07660 [Gemmataceae bacterium]|jgi:hypothetical protein|nr:hypothetical protein [Gemmataceae bacterium]